jgi:small-conductance mechanosensitive channel|uniref:hypothetical protein n=1 Tax=Prosthecobacter sp. TaxID=1965333 RepID=UPI003784C025
MFEFRLGSFLLKALLLVSCALGGYEYYSRVEQMKIEIADKKNTAQEKKDAVSSLKSLWQELETAQSQIKVLQKREEAELKQRDQIDQLERKLSGEIKYLALSMHDTVEKARAAAVGTMARELSLSGRPALQNAKILKIEDIAITFMHDDGVANLRLQVDELPPEMIQKFDMGLSGLAKQLRRLADSLAEPAKQK